MKTIAKETLKEARDYLIRGDAAACVRSLEAALVPESPETPTKPTPREAVNLALGLDLLGKARFALGRREDALAALRLGASFLENYLTKPEAEGRPELPTLLLALWQNVSFAALELQKPEIAREACAAAQTLARKLYAPDAPEMAAVYFGVSSLHYRLGDFHEAERLTLLAKEIWERPGTRNPEKAATCLNNLGRIYEERGETEKGIETHKQAVAARRELPNKADLAFSLGNLGVALAQAGRWREAAENLADAVDLYSDLGLGESREARGYAANLEICRRALAEEDG